MSETSSLAWRHHSPACYHEPKVHDYQLQSQLNSVNVYLLLPIAIMGVIFNSGAMVFLHRPPKITSGVFVYLKALLILDHLQLIFMALTKLMRQTCDANYSVNHTFHEICYFERLYLQHTVPRVTATINTMHVWTIAALSAHRYWKISRPVQARLKDTMGRAHTMLAGMLLTVLCFRLPLFIIELQFGWKPQFRVNKRTAATEVLSPYRIVYHSILDPLLSHVLPFIWMSLFSLLTLYEIFRSRHLSYQQIGFDWPKGNGLTQPLTTCFRKKAEIARQKQELRATISIVLIILLYLLFHSLALYLVVRKWYLIINHECAIRMDYIHSYLADLLSMISASINAFVFIAFTNRLRKYVQMLIRKTSRSLSSSSEPPLSPKTTLTVDGVHVHHHHTSHYHQPYSVPL